MNLNQPTSSNPRQFESINLTDVWSTSIRSIDSSCAVYNIIKRSRQPHISSSTSRQLTYEIVIQPTIFRWVNLSCILRHHRIFLLGSRLGIDRCANSSLSSRIPLRACRALVSVALHRGVYGTFGAMEKGCLLDEKMHRATLPHGRPDSSRFACTLRTRGRKGRQPSRGRGIVATARRARGWTRGRVRVMDRLPHPADRIDETLIRVEWPDPTGKCRPAAPLQLPLISPSVPSITAHRSLS